MNGTNQMDAARGTRTESVATRFWASKAVRWAAVYLCAAAALLSIAGTEFAGPSAERRATRVESEAASVLRSAVTTASGVADSWATSERARLKRRQTTLETALASSAAWARRTMISAGDADPDFAASVHDLAGTLHDDMSLSVMSTDGTALFVIGEDTDLDRALLEPVQRGFTVAVAWARPEGDSRARAQEAMRGSLLAGLRPGTGLYFVTADGESAADIAPRPVPGAMCARPLASAGTFGFSTNATGDLETGRLVSVRGAARELGWTVVGERFLTPAELAEGEQGVAGMLALSGLGLLAAAAFTHALRSGSSRREADTGAPVRVAAQRERVGQMQAAARATPQAPAMRDAEIAPTGNSILRLRQACGETGNGPDLSACARSPILRALASSLRSDSPQPLPREVRDWARAA